MNTKVQSFYPQPKTPPLSHEDVRLKEDVVRNEGKAMKYQSLSITIITIVTHGSCEKEKNIDQRNVLCEYSQKPS